MAIPVILQFVSSAYKWFLIEKREEKRWSWLFLLCQLWPQVKAIRVILLFCHGNPRATEKKKKMMAEIGTTEPFLEA